MIAAFVIVFAGVVIYSMRQRAAMPTATPEPVRATDPSAYTETGKGTSEQTKDGKVVTAVSFARQLTYSDGKVRGIDVDAKLTDKRGAADAPHGKGSGARRAAGTAAGAERRQADRRRQAHDRHRPRSDLGGAQHSATQTGILTIPGPVQFKKGRMTGRGVGATYNRNNDVLWILAEAHVTVAPDAAGGGAIEATAGSAGLARADNYMKLEKDARIVSDGRTAEAAIITLFLDQSGEKVQRMELREQSRITGSGAGASLMVAKDIDMTYGEDGRTLQSSKLMQNAVVELPARRRRRRPARIAGTTIDIAMSPDGATVTGLNAMERVQRRPAGGGDAPGKQIRSSSLHATGAPGQGLQNATFEGGVDYTEVRPAAGKTPAAERKARSLRLIVGDEAGPGADRAGRLPRQRPLHRRRHDRRGTARPLHHRQGHARPLAVGRRRRHRPGGHDPAAPGRGAQHPPLAVVEEADRRHRRPQQHQAAEERSGGRDGQDAGDAEAGPAGDRDVEPAGLRRRRRSDLLGQRAAVAGQRLADQRRHDRPQRSHRQPRRPRHVSGRR